MAKITLTLSLDNAAFDDETGNGWRSEVARILLTQSRQIESGWYATPDDLPTAVVWDTNGNTVGGWEMDPELPAEPAEVWLGDPDAASWAQLLDQMETIEEGQYHDLKMDTPLGFLGESYRTKVWLSRMGVEDGEPFPRTVYVEYLDGDSWCDLGYFDGGEPKLIPSHPLAVSAFQRTRDLVWEAQ